jgi:hypothetical protein
MGEEMVLPSMVPHSMVQPGRRSGREFRRSGRRLRWGSHRDRDSHRGRR